MINFFPTPTFVCIIPTRKSPMDALALNPTSRPTSGCHTFIPASATPILLLIWKRIKSALQEQRIVTCFTYIDWTQSCICCYPTNVIFNTYTVDGTLHRANLKRQTDIAVRADIRLEKTGPDSPFLLVGISLRT